MDESAEINFGRAVAQEIERAAALEPPTGAISRHLPAGGVRTMTTSPNAPPPPPPAQSAKQPLTREQHAAVFNASVALQGEFRTVENYAAYAMAAEAGRVKIAGAKVICGRPAADR